MPDNEYVSQQEGEGGFKEAVCIDAMRIYDSCSDKDCLEDIRVLFPAARQQLVDSATNVRIKDVSVITVYVDLQPIPFNKGFYSVDMTFFFDVCLDLFGGPTTCAVPVNGVSVFNKKVILYGSEGNVKMYSSGSYCDDVTMPEDEKVLPKATVQVAEPVALSAKLCEYPCGACDPYCRIPDCVCQRYGGDFETGPQHNCVYVTIGLFIIVQIVRNVQILIPAYDFCVPEKECVTSSDNPCDLFQRIEFPTDEFFPPKPTDLGGGCGCGR
ncbi:hypothetical protein AALD01_16740 [Oscillospiraceae bacterium 21-37]|jgi:hypothetical protein|uniref:hypothetical protein n=1 Tax=Eubacteriales TaxID=186802 RepID=UPI001EF0802F|nr:MULTISPECIES: hypothetical protein [unclassified Neglectibacter]